MDLRTNVTIAKTVRFDISTWEELVKYAESQDFPSENELLKHIFRAGLDALNEEAIDKIIESERCNKDVVSE